MFDIVSWFNSYINRNKKPIVNEEVRPPLHELFNEIRANKWEREEKIKAAQKTAPTEEQLEEKNTQDIIEYIETNLKEHFYKFKKESALCIVYDSEEIDIHHTLTFDQLFFDRVRRHLEMVFDDEVIIQFKCEKTFKHHCDFMEKDLYTLTINVYAIVMDVDNQQEDYPDNFIIENEYDIRGKCYHEVMEYIHSTTQQKEN